MIVHHSPSLKFRAIAFRLGEDPFPERLELLKIFRGGIP
jgi:hypothetical protein